MNESNRVQNAEDRLTSSIARFESAMERLAGKVEDTSHRMQHVVDIAKHQKDELLNLKNKTRDAVAPIMPYVYSAGSASRRMVSGVRQNPKPYIWSAIGLIGGLWALGYFSKKGEYSSMSGTTWDSESSFTPDSNISSGPTPNFQ
jgi:hypothetical protein